jgi:branched-chain amino acid transport system substrate-binding protein
VIRAALARAACLAFALVATGTTTGGTPARAAPDRDVVTIGFTGPLSGGAARFGDDARSGIQAAIDEIDRAGGIAVGGRTITFALASLDDAYRPDRSVRNAEHLVRAEGARVVFCPYGDGIFALLAVNERRAPRFIVGASAGDPAVLAQGNASVFMIAPRYDAYFKPWAAAEMKRFGKRLALLPTATAYGTVWKAGFGEAWKAAGGTVLRDDAVDYDATSDFSGIVGIALAEKPDVMLVGGPPDATARVIEAARAQGFAGGFALIDQAPLDRVARLVSLALLEGTVGAAPPDAYGGPGLAAFRATYARRYGPARAPTTEAVLDDVAMHVVARAMRLARSTSDAGAIARALGAAATSLPRNERAVAVAGVSRAGHLELNLFSEMVERGRYVRLAIPSLP